MLHVQCTGRINVGYKHVGGITISHRLHDDKHVELSRPHIVGGITIGHWLHDDARVKLQSATDDTTPPQHKQKLKL